MIKLELINFPPSKEEHAPCWRNKKSTVRAITPTCSTWRHMSLHITDNSPLRVSTIFMEKVALRPCHVADCNSINRTTL